jgi:hypothetical protein
MSSGPSYVPLSRRTFLTATANAAALAAASCAPSQVGGGGSTTPSATQDLVGDARHRRTFGAHGRQLTFAQGFPRASGRGVVGFPIHEAA